MFNLQLKSRSFILCFATLFLAGGISCDKEAKAKEHSAKADAFQKQGDLDSAIKELSKAIKFDPTNHGYHNQRGGMYAAQGKIDLGIVDVTKAIELCEDTHGKGVYYSVRCIMYNGKGDNVKAEADFDSAKRAGVNPYDVMKHLNTKSK